MLVAILWPRGIPHDETATQLDADRSMLGGGTLDAPDNQVSGGCADLVHRLVHGGKRRASSRHGKIVERNDPDVPQGSTYTVVNGQSTPSHFRMWSRRWRRVVPRFDELRRGW